MPFKIIRNDITKVRADAIVNTANPEPVIGGGTDSAIYQAAGRRKLLKERRKIGLLHVGEAVVTPAFHLDAKYIIHTVGPEWQGGQCGEYEALTLCYRKPLLMAEQLGCRSIAFPLISTGTYGFPKDKALSIALRTISDFLESNESDMDVTLVVFGKESYELSKGLADDVRQYIDENYVAAQLQEEYGFGSPEEDRSRRLRGNRKAESRPVYDAPSVRRESTLSPRKESSGGFRNAVTEPLPDLSYTDALPAAESLDDVLKHIGDNFQEHLLKLIDDRGLKDSEVYKRANIDRKLFSKIRCNKDYCPGKKTAVALAVALRLNLDETYDLLKRAGHALSPGSKFDLIVEYCIEHEIFDIFEINAILFDYDQPLLGS